MSEPDDGPAPEDEVGSVSDEAVKLFGALSDWARDHGTEFGHGLSGLADQAARSAHEVNEHIATDSDECTYCPICRTVHLVRQASPEVRNHLAVAASSLLQAVAGVLATVPAEPGANGRAHGGAHRGAHGGGVEHIDLDSDEHDGGWPEESDE